MNNSTIEFQGNDANAVFYEGFLARQIINLKILI